MAIGVVMVFSATANLTASLLPIDTPGQQWYRQWIGSTPLRQISFAVAAAAVMLVVSRCPYRWWRLESTSLRQPAILLLILTVFTLVLVYVPGVGIERNGARRWIRFGPASAGVGFQPSELAKLALLVFLAAWMSQPRIQMKSFRKGFLPAATAIGLIAAIVGIEDLSTAALLATVGGGMLLAGGARIRHLVLVAMPGVLGFAVLVISRPYRLQRLLGFTDIWADPRGAGFHPVQSLLTIASGDWVGRGLGMGVQKLGYLPESHSDFIFAVICEELGVAGGALVVGLFIAFLWGGRKAMLGAADDLGRYLALGATLMIGTQVAMNVGVVTVSLPTTGISLPLVSAGGSGLLFLGASVGLLANVAQSESEPKGPGRRKRVSTARAGEV